MQQTPQKQKEFVAKALGPARSALMAVDTAFTLLPVKDVHTALGTILPARPGDASSQRLIKFVYSSEKERTALQAAFVKEMQLTPERHAENCRKTGCNYGAATGDGQIVVDHVAAKIEGSDAVTAVILHEWGHELYKRLSEDQKKIIKKFTDEHPAKSGTYAGDFKGSVAQKDEETCVEFLATALLLRDYRSKCGGQGTPQKFCVPPVLEWAERYLTVPLRSTTAVDPLHEFLNIVEPFFEPHLLRTAAAASTYTHARKLT
jgi:hypothetical protein